MFYYCCCWVTSILKACCKIANVFLKSSLWGIFTQKPQCFSFHEAFRDAWWVTRIKIRVLKGLCRFEICSQIKNKFFEESVTFVHYSVQENRLCSWYFIHEFDCRMKAVCLQEKFFYFVSVCIPLCSGTPDDRFLSNAVLSMWSTFKVL